MKKTSDKERERDVRRTIAERQQPRTKKKRSSYRNSNSDQQWKLVNSWVDKWRHRGLEASIDSRRRVELHLPREMDFYQNYDSTVLYVVAIRELCNTAKLSNKAYKLKAVNFDELRKISTSAALVLTAELSKWDDAVRQRLRPLVDNWDDSILRQFTDLGFFELFHNVPQDIRGRSSLAQSRVSTVQYIKGHCGNSAKIRELKEEISNIIDRRVEKWTFLHSGITEAITNVTHHAYPNNSAYAYGDKNWYLTGSFNRETRKLKIVFYDQGIGIPQSLPASDVWERVLSYLSGLPLAERRRDEVLLKAAVQLDRTSSGSSDRGKGLQDLLEFIRQRGDGYLAIMSLKGLYKLSILGGKEHVKTEHFDNPIQGTLIIWSSTLKLDAGVS